MSRHFDNHCRDAVYQWNARVLSLEEIPLIKGIGVLPLSVDAVSRRFVDASVANEVPFTRRFTVSSGHFLSTKTSDQLPKANARGQVDRLTAPNFH